MVHCPWRKTDSRAAGKNWKTQWKKARLQKTAREAMQIAAASAIYPAMNRLPFQKAEENNPQQFRRAKMKIKKITPILLACTLFAVSALAGHHEGDDGDKPGMAEGGILILEATVVAVDYENRRCSLKGPKGNVVTIDVGPEVKNLAQVEVGDQVNVEYMETVAIQLLSGKDVQPGAAGAVAVASARKGEKPAGLAVEETTVIVTIEAIDTEHNLVTLKTAEGVSKTVAPRNPDNLKRVKVGDRVMITYTAALGISVTEKTAEN